MPQAHVALHLFRQDLAKKPCPVDRVVRHTFKLISCNIINELLRFYIYFFLCLACKGGMLNLVENKQAG